MIESLRGLRIGCAMTGSFCTFRKVFEVWRALKAAGAELIPIMSFNACSVDTRFYPACEAVGTFEEIAGRKVIASLNQAEPIGPKKLLDLLIIAPCTGNTLAKLAAGIADTPVTLAAKSHLRNGRPVLIAPSTNDGLGRNAENLGKLQAMRDFYFVPYGQDAPEGKPASLVSYFDRIPQAAQGALEGRQIQPLLI